MWRLTLPTPSILYSELCLEDDSLFHIPCFFNLSYNFLYIVTLCMPWTHLFCTVPSHLFWQLLLSLPLLPAQTVSPFIMIFLITHRCSDVLGTIYQKVISENQSAIFNGLTNFQLWQSSNVDYSKKKLLEKQLVNCNWMHFRLLLLTAYTKMKVHGSLLLSSITRHFCILVAGGSTWGSGFP